MNQPLQDSQNSHPKLVFFKDFITVEANSSIVPNCLRERKMQKPQRSHIALKKMLNDIDNNRAKSKQAIEECQLRRSITSEAKRIKVEDPIIHNEFNVLLRTIHRKAKDGERSKTVGKCTREQEDNKFAKIGQLNKNFKQKRENSLKQMLNGSFYKSLVENRKNQLAANSNSNGRSKIKTSTMPLQTKYKSSGHFAPFCSNNIFEVRQSSDILNSNLLNPQPEEKMVRKESSDSAKRFYLKLKKAKLGGNLWKNPEKQPTLLESESVSKEIPSELGIYKIKLPKRNYRHEFLQNIQKIKENYLRIKGNGQEVKTKESEQPSKSFQRTANKGKRKDRKMYEIKYRGAIDYEQKQLTRSKTQFLQNRTYWESFINTPLEPWETEDTTKMFR